MPEKGEIVEIERCPFCGSPHFQGAPCPCQSSGSTAAPMGTSVGQDARFCGSCGAQTAATAPPPWGPPERQVVRTRPGSGALGRAAKVLGIIGGILGIIAGLASPFMAGYFAGVGYGGAGFSAPDLGISAGRLLLSVFIGFLCGAGGIAGGAIAEHYVWPSRIALLTCGALGFVIGLWWLVPGLMLLVAGGLEVAVKDRVKV